MELLGPQKLSNGHGRRPPPQSVSAATVSVDASAVIGCIAAIHNLTEGPITQSDWLVESGSTRPDKSSKNFSAGFLRAVRDYPPSPDSS